MRIRVFIKKSAFLKNILSNLLYYYLSICYFTSSWSIKYRNAQTQDFLKQYLKQYKNSGIMFALWHEQLAFGNGIFMQLGIKNISGLISNHSDGRLISSVVQKFGFSTISGSTSKNSVSALKSIISKLSKGEHILITPDGPRGPARRVNSSIAQICARYDAALICICVTSTKCFRIKSWDRMIIPLPFAKITINIMKQEKIIGDKSCDDRKLTEILNYY